MCNRRWVPLGLVLVVGLFFLGGGWWSRTLAQTPNTVTAGEADLRISKTGNPSALEAGQPLTFTIVVTNIGPVSAQNVLIRDVLPPGLQMSGTSTIDVFNGSGADIDVEKDGLTATVATLFHEGRIVIIARAKVVSAATGPTITNTVNVTTSNDNVPNNNAASFSVDVTPLPTPTETPSPTPIPSHTPTPSRTPVPPTPAVTDLGISKSASPNPVAPGGALTYTLLVRNLGAGPAQQLVIRDELPEGVSFFGPWTVNVFRGTQSSTSLSMRNFTTTIGTLNVGGIVTVTFRTLVAANATGPLLNTANVTAANDSNNTNNSVTQSTTLSAQPNTPTPTSTPPAATSTPTVTTTPTATSTPTFTATSTATPTATPTAPTATATIVAGAPRNLYIPLIER